MRVLDKKLLRDFRRLWAQGLAIAMVMACGVATLIMAVGAFRSLEESRSAFYDRYRFGSIFAAAVRAPTHLQSRIEAISGVAATELRIMQPAILDIEGMNEPASGLAVSVPDFDEPSVNRIYIRAGRLPEPGRGNEVAVSEPFATAHGFRLGNSFSAIMNGQKHPVTIVGIVLSPEFIYAIGPGDMLPDQRRFGVFFMSKSVLAGLYDLNGAFNSVSLTTLRNANTDNIIEQLDALLKPYGGTGAHDRSEQISHAFLDAELDQLWAMAAVIPPIFLFVSAFLVNMILARLIALEREQVGLLKAVGYSTVTIGWHYAKLVTFIAIIGIVIGSGAGFWLGRALTRLYGTFYSFPFLIFRQSPDLYLLAGGVTVTAALAGAFNAIRTIADLPPATAMRPPAPANYRGFLPHWLPKLHFMSQLTIMALRHLIRWPVRTFLTILGTALSVALLVTSMFSYDSIDMMIDTIFFQTERQDATISFAADQHKDTIFDVAALPGVLLAEPFRSVAAKLKNSHWQERVAITGLPERTDLSRVLDPDFHPIVPPGSGLMLSESLARKLHAGMGDRIDVELLEKNGRTERLTVTAIAQGFVGLTAYMRLDALNRLMLEGDQISGALIKVDTNAINRLYQAVKETPQIASIALQKITLQRFRRTIEENITTSTTIYIALAVIITFGVIYNSARIQLSERARELASLRVFGFTRAEVSSVLMTELTVIVLLAQPLGWLMGYGLAWSVVRGLDTDLFRIPLVVNSETYAIASIVVLSSALFSALVVRRRINRLDLIKVLKTRE